MSQKAKGLVDQCVQDDCVKYRTVVDEKHSYIVPTVIQVGQC